MSEHQDRPPEAPPEAPADQPQPQAAEGPQPQPAPDGGQKKGEALRGAILSAALCRLLPGLSFEDAGKLGAQLAALAEAATDEEIGQALSACRGGK